MSRLTNHNSYGRSPGDLNQLRFAAKSIGILALLTGLIYLRVVGLDSVSAIRTGQWGQSSVILFFLMVGKGLWEKVCSRPALHLAAGSAGRHDGPGQRAGRGDFDLSHV